MATNDERRREFLKDRERISRYRYTRWITAIFFFINFYWMFLLFMNSTFVFLWPTLLLGLSFVALMEQMRVLKSRYPKLTATRFFLATQFIFNVIVLILSPKEATRDILYPFLVNTRVAVGALFLGCLLLGLSFWEITVRDKEQQEMRKNNVRN